MRGVVRSILTSKATGFAGIAASTLLLGVAFAPAAFAQAPAGQPPATGWTASTLLWASLLVLMTGAAVIFASSKTAHERSQ